MKSLRGTRPSGSMHRRAGETLDAETIRSLADAASRRGEARARRDAGRRTAAKAYRKPYVEPVAGGTRPSGSMHRRAGGFTMVELTIVCALIMILTAMVIPISRYATKRQKEVELRYDLRMMRNAIDKYKQYSDAGLIPVDLGTEGYPKTMDVMVEGVNQIGQISKKLKFLRKVPVDPMTGKAEWGLRSLQDDPTSTSWGGQDVYDVYSLSRDRAIDKSSYKDW
ncbi:MAG TPA: type II secretion system protein [Thermoanaerobaculia bacterium]|nr:type II secretion system protein [Thermoanaerobaculia bacterium]